MTQSKNVQDTNIPLLMDDEIANPYNKKKYWQDNAPSKQVQSADSMFFPENKAKPKAQSDELDEDNEKESKPNHDYEKRWKDSEKKRLQERRENEARLKKLEEELAKLTSSKNDKPNVEDEDDIEKLRKSDPDFFSKVEKVASKLVQTQTSEVKTQVEDIQRREFELAKQEARRQLVKAHPDVDQIVMSDEFEDWAKAQPQNIRDWIYKNPTDSTLAIRAIDLYKLDVSNLQKDKESKTRNKSFEEDASSLVSTRRTKEPDTSGKKIWTRKEIKNLPMHLYDKYEAEIDEAIREGRITD